LRLALDAILEGRPVPYPRTRAIGCYIGSESTTLSDVESND
jgi:hypothetical protein